MKEGLYNIILTRVERAEPRGSPSFLVQMIGWTDTAFTQTQITGAAGVRGVANEELCLEDAECEVPVGHQLVTHGRLAELSKPRG